MQPITALRTFFSARVTRPLRRQADVTRLIGATCCAASLTLATAAHAASRPTASIAVPASPSVIDRVKPAAAPWWHGFRDPALDTLMRSAREAAGPPLAQRVDLEAQIGMRYITARWLASRLALSRDLLQALAKRRSWVELEGPTPHAAKTLSGIDQMSARLEGEIEEIAQHCDAIVAQLQERTSMPIGAFHALLEVALTRASVPIFEPMPAMAPDPRWQVALTHRPALRERESEVAHLGALQAQRVAQLDAARKRLEAGIIGEQAVMAVYESVLMNADKLLNAQASLAAEWVQAATGTADAMVKSGP